MTIVPLYFVFAACLITVSTFKSRRYLPINRNCYFNHEISSELCNKGDLISSEVADCERDVLHYQIRQTCVPHHNDLFSKVTEPPDLSYGANCTPKTNLPMLCGSSGTDTRCVCDKSYSYLTNQCRCQYWPTVDYRSDKPSFCTQYDHGGTTGIHLYTCCNNCNEDDDICKSSTYHGGSGVARGGAKGAIAPPFFGFPPPTCHTRMHARRKNTAGPELAREITIGHVVTLGDGQTRRGIYWLRRLRNIKRRSAPTPRSQLERKILVGEFFCSHARPRGPQCFLHY